MTEETSTHSTSTPSSSSITQPSSPSPSIIISPQSNTTYDFEPDPNPWSTRSFYYQYKPFRGMIQDVKKRLPFYFSDWSEGFLIKKNGERVLGATVRMYFLK